MYPCNQLQKKMYTFKTVGLEKKQREAWIHVPFKLLAQRNAIKCKIVLFRKAATTK